MEEIRVAFREIADLASQEIGQTESGEPFGVADFLLTNVNTPAEETFAAELDLDSAT